MEKGEREMSMHLTKLWSYIKDERFAADDVCTRVWFMAAHHRQLDMVVGMVVFTWAWWWET